MKSMKIALALGLAALALVGCAPKEATMTFSLTDAPVDASNIKSVWVQVTGVAVHSGSKNAGKNDAGWESATLSVPAEIDLLSLQDGLTQALGQVVLEAGTTVQQIRLDLGYVKVEETGGTRKDATFNDETGLRINAHSFAVPLSGSASIVVDFDVRKSLVSTNSGYKLKPVLRAVFEGEAGKISGAAPASSDAARYLVYAYEPAKAAAIAGADPADVSGTYPVYGNAYTTAKVGDEGHYGLHYLDAGTYDIWLVAASDATGTPLKIIPGVVVESGKTTSLDITLP